MAAKFDNLDDVIGKFAGTICYYDNKPCYVKTASGDPEGKNEGYYLHLQTGQKKYEVVSLEDPKLNYRDFHIGYVNAGPYASWWFRKPHKQYSQGLKKNQLSCKVSLPGIAYGGDGFCLNKPFSAMLENVYPSVEACQKILRDGDAVIVAFHKDFALSWDDIHGDYIIEYRGKQIGATVGPNVKSYRLKPDYQFVNEALKEALPYVHG